MHRGHLDPAVATLPLAAERCGPLIKRAASLFADLRARGIPVVHVVTEYRDAAEIAANPFWTAIHEDSGKARRGILGHNLAGGVGAEIIAELLDARDLIVRTKKRYSVFTPTDLEFVLRRRLGADTVILAAPSSAQKGPIKIGMLVPQTGPLAANGKDMVNGFELFFEEQKYRLAGREVKFIVEDDEGKPATGITKARGLVESQGVHLLTGPLSAAVGYAVSPYIESKKIPAIYPIVSADDLTQRKRNPYLVRTGWASSQPSHPFGKWVVDNLRYRKIAMIGYDFAF